MSALRKLGLALIIVLLLLLPLVGGNGSSLSVGYSNDQSSAAAHSSPQMFIVGAMAAALWIIFPRGTTKAVPGSTVRLRRRVGALLTDFMLILMSFGPLVNFTFLWIEAQATGVFAWSFERDFSRPTDFWVAVPLILSMQLSLILNGMVHMAIRRQTFGQFLFGYRMVPDPEAEHPSRPVVSALLAIPGICLWPFSLIEARSRSDRRTVWDRASGMCAVLVRAKASS